MYKDAVIYIQSLNEGRALLPFTANCYIAVISANYRIVYGVMNIWPARCTWDACICVSSYISNAAHVYACCTVSIGRLALRQLT